MWRIRAASRMDAFSKRNSHCYLIWMPGSRTTLLGPSHAAKLQSSHPSIQTVLEPEKERIASGSEQKQH